MVDRLSTYVRQLSGMQDNTKHGSLTGRVVADLDTGDPEIHEAILAAGVSRCYVVGDRPTTVSDPRIERAAGLPWNATLQDVNVAFFDGRAAREFDPVHGIALLMSHMRTVMAPDGLVYAIVRTASGSTGFDVYNSIVHTPLGLLPREEYFFDEVAKACTVRILHWLPTEAPGVATRFMRLSNKKPTVLLIFGRSQSGKTSLARDLQRLDRHMHVSNDYLYTELVRLRQAGQTKGLDVDLLARLGDGSGRACGLFNRELESDPDLLRRYLHIVEQLFSHDKQLLSMDLDLIDEKQIGIVVQHFASRGYSPWVVTRDRLGSMN